MGGDPTTFNGTEFVVVVAVAFNVSTSQVTVSVQAPKRSVFSTFNVVATVTYPTQTEVPDNTQIYADINSSGVTTYLQNNNFELQNIDIVTSINSSSSGTSGSNSDGVIIAAVVVPVVVVLVLLVGIAVILRIRRQRWEKRGLELEQIYTSF